MNVATLKDDLSGIIHGTTLNKVTNLDGLIVRAGRAVVADVDLQETKRITTIPNAIFDEVYLYQAPQDLKRIIDIRPQVNRNWQDRFRHTYNATFDMLKAQVGSPSLVTVQWNSGIQNLLIKRDLPANVLLNGCDSLTENGTVSVNASASDLMIDTLNKVSGSGSIRFNILAGLAGDEAVMEIDGFTAIDLTRDETVGTLFAWVYMPTGSDFTDVTLKFGNNSGADYWEITTNNAQGDVAFKDGWNLIAFPWETATVTGAPDFTAVTWLSVGLTYDGTAQTAVRIDSIVSSLGALYEIEYYSGWIFRDATTNAFLETITSDTNVLNLNTDSYNLLVNKCALLIAQQLGGSNAGFDTTFFVKEYADEKARYLQKYKSEALTTQESYYNMPPKRQGYTRIRNGY
jgi:hypothetical protein